MAPAKKTRQAQCHSLTIEEVPLAKLKPWKENPRKSGATVEAVKKSIQTFGFNVPIICTNGLRIVAGHARRKAARSLGLKTVPIIKVSMEDWKADAFAVAENQTASVAEWDIWCIPLLIGTGLFDWLRDQGAASVREAVMFRGMSGSEYSHSLHGRLELYKHLDMPCFNPMLRFSRDEILETIRLRYALPLNPVYRHMNRSYCICCYTSDAKRQLYRGRLFPRVCHKYYRQIEELLFDSGLVDKSCTEERFMSREEKLDRHGFVHWRRAPEQCSVAAVKRHLPSGAVQYVIRDKSLIDLKHLKPLQGRWLHDGNEIRFWDVREKSADTVMRRMLNCVNCGFCMVECFPCRRFDKKKRTLRIEACTECGKCLQLKFCMGWKHRFWRRDIGRKESGR